MTDFTCDFRELLTIAIQDTVSDVDGALDELVTYAQEQAAALSLLVDLAGYQHALVAAQNNVAMRAGVLAVRKSRAAKERSLRLITTALSMMAKLLAAGLV